MQIFGRLLTFLHPYRKGVAWSFALAAGAMGMTVLIPWETGRAIDAIGRGDHDALITWAIAIAAAGILRLGLSVMRRLVAGRGSLGGELDLRNPLYRHLQRLRVSVFCPPPTGPPRSPPAARPPRRPP